MSLHQSPKIVTNGLVMYCDMSNTAKSWNGPLTTNLNAGVGIGTYLNTPSDVTSSLTVTGEYYKGSPVYKQVLTPITATGVGYLTNASNPGIGVVTGGGGGAAARYTGHSIFFKPAAGRDSLNASTPIYTHYSNIGGWQSTGNYDDMGDGWYRAHVIFYSAGGGSDGKYWAINPAGATLNVPITIFWAGPFKEDRNDSARVSPYIPDSRSASQAIVDLTGNNLVTATSLTYAADNTFRFNGSSDYIFMNNNTALDTQTPTVDVWIKTNATTQNGFWFEKGSVNTQYALFQEGTQIQWRMGPLGDAISYATASSINTLGYFNVVATRESGNQRLYINGVNVATGTQTGTLSTNSYGMNIGRHSSGYYYNGILPLVKVYNRALTASEVQQNFNAHRGRYGI